MQESPKPQREKLIPFWFVLALGACLTLLTEVLRRDYNSAVGRVAIKPGATVLMAIGLPLGLYLINVITKRNDIIWVEASGERAENIRSAVIALGLENVSVRVYSKGGPDLPKLEAGVLKMSRDSYATLSQEAIIWNAATEVALHKNLIVNPEVIMSTILSLGISVFAFMDRLRVDLVWWTNPGFLTIYGTLYFAGLRNKVRRKADRTVTNLPRDYSAAKELLSYTYFRTHNEITLAWIPSLENEFLTRAKYLGIELERSYRVPAGDTIEGRG